MARGFYQNFLKFFSEECSLINVAFVSFWTPYGRQILASVVVKKCLQTARAGRPTTRSAAGGLGVFDQFD